MKVNVIADRETGVTRVVFSSFATAIPTLKFHVSPFIFYAEFKLHLSGMAWTN